MRTRTAVILSAFAVLLSLVAYPAHADEVRWKKVYEKSQASQNDQLTFVGSGSATQMVAFGVESGSSGDTPMLLTTTNGRSFTKGAVPAHPSMPWLPFNMFSDFSMVDGSLGFAACAMGGIFKTSDGGKNWEITAFNPSESTSFVFAVNTMDIWALSTKPQVHNSLDGGVQWTTAALPVDQGYEVTGLFFLDAQTGFVTGCQKTYQDDGSGNETLTGVGKGFLLRTLDGGAQWTPVQENYSQCLEEPHFVSATEGYVVGFTYSASADYKSYVYKTTDGGENLTSLMGTGAGQIAPSGLDGSSMYMVAGIGFSDALHGWVVANYGVSTASLMATPLYYYTQDGGVSFAIEMDEVGLSHGINDVVFCGEECGWAVGTGHRVFRLGSSTVVTDGDADSTDRDGGDSVVTDVEEEPTTGPGWPGTPCRNPNGLSLPQCDPTRGANTCLFNNEGSFCTYACTNNAQCGDIYSACCKAFTVDGQTKKYCTWDMDQCGSSDSDQYTTASGKSLGETCAEAGVLSDCGTAWGATVCIGGPYGSFCSKPCQYHNQCPGSNCCAELAPGMMFCVYGDELMPDMCPANYVDGDALEQESMETVTDEPEESGTGATGGGGCVAGGGAWLWGLAAAAMARRRRR